MPHSFANALFSEPVKDLQTRHGSRAAYERMAKAGAAEQSLGPDEIDFIATCDSFYMATVTPDGWPYVQHRGGPAGFLATLDPHTLAFADYSGNKQYISAGNLSVNDRFALFLLDYPQQARLKIIGHADLLEPADAQHLLPQLLVEPHARIDRVFVLRVLGFDWNCSQHITPRYTAAEWRELQQIAPFAE